MAKKTVQKKTPATYILRYGVIAYLFFLVGWPVFLVGQKTFANGFESLHHALTDPYVAFSLQLTFTVAIQVVIINTIFGIGISLLLTRFTFPGKRLLSSLLDLPLSVSPIVVGLALILVYGSRNSWLSPILEDQGWKIIYTPTAIVMATAFITLPLVIREIVPVLQELGTDEVLAAKSLGANSVQTFLRITLPTIKWAVIYGVVLTLARSLGEFGAVKVVSGNLEGITQTATLIVEQRYQNFEQGTAYATAFLLASVSVACIIVVSFLRKDNHK